MMSVFFNGEKLAPMDLVTGTGPRAGLNMLPVSSMQNSSKELLEKYGWYLNYANAVHFVDKGVLLDALNNQNYVDLVYNLTQDIIPNTVYTFSMSLIYMVNVNAHLFFVEKDKSGKSFSGDKYIDHMIRLNNSWHRGDNTFTFRTSNNPDLSQLEFHIRAEKGNKIQFSHLKFELGSHATIWTPAGGEIETLYNQINSGGGK